MMLKLTKYVVSRSDPNFIYWDDFFVGAGYRVEETSNSVSYSKEEMFEATEIVEADNGRTTQSD